MRWQRMVERILQAIEVQIKILLLRVQPRSKGNQLIVPKIILNTDARLKTGSAVAEFEVLCMNTEVESEPIRRLELELNVWLNESGIPFTVPACFILIIVR